MANNLRNLKIPPEYKLLDNALQRVVKSNREDKLEIELGDAKRSDKFLPQLKLKRWSNEVNASFGLIDNEPKQLSVDGGKIKLIGDKKEVHFYDLGEDVIQKKGRINREREWSFEQEVVLKEKPESNVIEFAVKITGLQLRPHKRGYEFFRKIPLPEAMPEGEKQEYKETAFYLNPITIKDVKGRELRKSIELTNNSLKIIIDSRDLENAVYPVSIDPSYTVASGVVYNDATGYDGHVRMLSRSSNGDLHCVWNDKRGTYYQIYYAKSTDGGETWEETAITSANYNQYAPAIAIDSNDYIHIVWRGNHADSETYIQIRYILNNGSWQSIENLTSGDYNQRYPSIAIDSNDYIHITWDGVHATSNNYNQIRYIKNTGDWGEIENLTASGNYAEYNPAIAIDSNDYIHIAWQGDEYNDSGFSQLRYIKNTGTWQAVETLTSGNYHQYSPSIAIDSNDYIHIVWQGYITTSIYRKIRYIKNTGTWQAIESFTDEDYNQYRPSISIDSNDYIHIAWEGYHAASETYLQIRYLLNDGSWQAVENLTSASDDQKHAQLIWATNPIVGGLKICRPKTGYAFIWTDCTDTNSVMFYKSADLDWDTAGPTEVTITAKGRIQTSSTQAIQAKGRIQKSITQTLTSKGRITLAGVSQTITAKGDVKKSTTQALTAKASIKKSFSQTIQAKGRIGLVTNQTLTAKGQIKVPTTQTITAKGDIKLTATQTIQSKATIKKTNTQTVTAKGRLQIGSTQTLTAKARIAIVPTQTCTSKANIKATTTRAVTAKASIKKTTTQTGIAYANKIYPVRYYPASLFHLETSYYFSLSSQSRRFAIRFTAQRSAAVEKLHLDFNLVGTSPTYQYSIQADDNGEPSGTPLSYRQDSVASEGWKEISLLSVVNVTAGTNYWIVVEWVGGTVSDVNCARILFSARANYLLPYDNIRDEKQRIIYDTGDGVWVWAHGTTQKGYNPRFLLEYSDGKFEGVPIEGRTDTTAKVYGDNQHSEVFVAKGTTIISTIGAYVCKYGTPTDDLNYEILDSEDVVLRSGVLVTVAGASTDFQWEEVALASALTLTHGETYRLVLKSSGDASNYWRTYQVITPDVASFKQHSWWGTNGYYSKTDDGGSSWTDYDYADMLFRFQSTSTNFPQTLTAKAAIKKTSTQTITSRARIQISSSQTVTAKANIVATQSQSLTVKGDIKSVQTQTCAAKGAIKKTFTQTLTAKGRIQQPAIQTITAKGRIQKTFTQTLTAKGRITATAVQSVTAKANIVGEVSQTIQAKGNVRQVSAQTIATKASIRKTTSQSLTTKGRIGRQFAQTIAAKGRIQLTSTQTLTAKGRITVSSIQTISAKADIVATQIQTIDAKASIKLLAVERTILAKGRIEFTSTQTIQAQGRIEISSNQTLTAKGRITTTVSQTVQAKGDIKKQTAQTVTAKGAIKRGFSQTVTAKGRITTAGVSQTIQAKGRIQIGPSQTIQAKGAIKKQLARSLTAKSSIKKLITQIISSKGRITISSAQTIEAKARIQILGTQTITAKATIKRELTQTIATKGRIATPGITRTITAKASIKKSFTQTIETKGRIEIASTQTIQAKARITITSSQSVDAKGNIRETTTQAINAKASIKKTFTQELTVKGRIQLISTQSLTAKGRIQKQFSQIIDAKGRITVTGVEQTLDAKANILASQTQTITAKASIKKGVTQQMISAAAILVYGITQTVDAKGRIETRPTQTIQAKANIKKTSSQTINTKASIKKGFAQSLTSKGDIKQTQSLGHLAYFWTTQYEANELPTAATPAWTKSPWFDVDTEEISPAGFLHLVSNTNGDATYYQNDNNLDYSVGATLEVRFKMISGYTYAEAIDAMSFTLFAGAKGCYVDVYSDTIELSGGGGRHDMDTTDGYHTYRVTIHGSTTNVYVDGVLVLSGTPDNVGGGQIIFTGGEWWGGSIESSWDYVYYSSLGAFAPDPYAKASIKKTPEQTINARGRIATTNSQTVQAKGRIQISSTQNVDTKGRVEKASTQTISARGRITIATTQTIDAKGNIKLTASQTINAGGCILNPISQTVDAKANIKEVITQTLEAKGCIFGEAAVSTVTAKARLQVISVVEIIDPSRSLVIEERTCGYATIREKVCLPETRTYRWTTAKGYIIRR